MQGHSRRLCHTLPKVCEDHHESHMHWNKIQNEIWNGRFSWKKVLYESITQHDNNYIFTGDDYSHTVVSFLLSWRCNGVVTGITDLDPYRWPNSKWRCLMVSFIIMLSITDLQYSHSLWFGQSCILLSFVYLQFLFFILNMRKSLPCRASTCLLGRPLF